MMVFSCLVKGCLRRPDLSRNLVQTLTKKKLTRLAARLKEGMIPVVRLIFMTMRVKGMLRMK
ncbi:hypothetical protein TIFTF001_020473 [Ficus carica]|uniref:Uncharacterized protein n=1 Tax=Ficus carica TaxID=3494 RepID=A0AA88A8M4_FICCA|nr:hypothetical protein TIFTF001_020473 [Ficus carica]